MPVRCAALDEAAWERVLVSLEKQLDIGACFPCNRTFGVGVIDFERYYFETGYRGYILYAEGC